jgi:hypothetical protein
MFLLPMLGRPLFRVHSVVFVPVHQAQWSKGVAAFKVRFYKLLNDGVPGLLAAYVGSAMLRFL